MSHLQTRNNRSNSERNNSIRTCCILLSFVITVSSYTTTTIRTTSSSNNQHIRQNAYHSNINIATKWYRTQQEQHLSSTCLSVTLGNEWDTLVNKIAATATSVTIPSSKTTSSISSFPSIRIPSLSDTVSDASVFVNTIISSITDIKSPEQVITALVSFIETSASTYWTLPLWIQVSIATTPVIAIIGTTLIALSYPDDDYRTNLEPYSRGEYDPALARIYYSKHPVVVLQRLLQLFRLSNSFIFGILVDKYITKNEEDPKQRTIRAVQLLQLITQLGPTAIKVGQALSVRPDLIPEEYAKTLSSLQDQVPPFDGKQAQALLLEELQRPLYSNVKISCYTKPVASASIGQVYRGTVKVPTVNADGTIDTNNMITKDVAIKVQRPNGLSEIALDLYLVREIIAPIWKRITNSATDLQSLVNEWGRGFIAELDYRREAESTIRFNYEMSKRNLNAVCAPIVIEQYSTERILVTEWINGQRIDYTGPGSDPSDIPRLCTVALNAYLVMLLELKTLHCDPHPGNLLRTTDGKLCILDFGMTLDIDTNLQYSLLEFVAHLTSENFDQLPEDLASLGFLKRDKIEYIRRTGVLEPLKFFLNQAGKGGGANAVRDRIFDEYRAKYPGRSDDELRVEMRAEMKQQMSDMVQKESVATGITLEVEDLQRRNRDSFQIPEWFVYSSRAFLTLEGVSLAANDNYSLIKSCFPYVAKRLVADDDPRARKALKELIYSAAGDGVDPKRLTDLADGFTSYTTTTKTINQQANAHDGEVILVSGEVERVSKERDRRRKMIEAEATMTLAKDSADVLLSPDGNLVQSLIVEESALAASANIKDIVKLQLIDTPRQFRESLPFGIGTFLPPLPFESQVEPFVRKTSKEIRAQQLTGKIFAIAQSQQQKTSTLTTNGDSTTDNTEGINSVLETIRGLEPEQAALVLKELRENLPRYAPLIGRLGGKFVSILLNTASTNMEGTLNELEENNNNDDIVFRATMKQLSNAAQYGADAIETSPLVSINSSTSTSTTTSISSSSSSFTATR